MVGLGIGHVDSVVARTGTFLENIEWIAEWSTRHIPPGPRDDAP